MYSNNIIILNANKREWKEAQRQCGKTEEHIRCINRQDAPPKADFQLCSGQG